MVMEDGKGRRKGMRRMERRQDHHTSPLKIIIKCNKFYVEASLIWCMQRGKNVL
jgi:hypothetical protein